MYSKKNITTCWYLLMWMFEWVEGVCEHSFSSSIICYRPSLLLLFHGYEFFSCSEWNLYASTVAYDKTGNKPVDEEKITDNVKHKNTTAKFLFELPAVYPICCLHLLTYKAQYIFRFNFKILALNSVPAEEMVQECTDFPLSQLKKFHYIQSTNIWRKIC